VNDTLVAGRYRLGRRIGTGGMGRVWLARDEVLRRSVAVKEVLLPEAPSEDEAYELRMRTLREARAAARLSHPNVVRIYDVMYADDRPWIVMEYIPSRSLAQVIKVDGPLEPAHVARVGIAVLDALLAAHAAGVLHRDVKPGNVLLADDGRVVLTDFGLATFDEIGSNLTQSGVVHGSPQFIAPERALHGASTVEADMWSLGATLYAAVEGQSPYSRPTSYQTLAAMATAPPDPPKRAGALKPVLAGLLRRNPRSRMKPHEVRTRLQRIAGGETGRSWLAPRPRKQDPDPATVVGPAAASMQQAPTYTPGRVTAQMPPPTTAAADPDSGTGAGTASAPDPAPIATPAAGSLTPLPRRIPGRTTPAVAPAAPRPPDSRQGPALPRSLRNELPRTLRDVHSARIGPGQTATRARRPSVTAVAIVLIIAAIGYIVQSTTRGPGPNPNPGSTALPPASSAPAIVNVAQEPTVRWPCPVTIPDSAVPVPIAPPDPERPGLAADLIWYQDSTGMLIPVPPGWQMVRGGGTTCFYDGSLPRSLAVGQVAAPAGTNPTGVLNAMELAARGHIPGYHLLRPVQPVTFLDDQAEWEYTFHGPSGTMHTIVRDYLRPGRASLVAWTTTDDSWTENKPIFQLITVGFTPAA